MASTSTANAAGSAPAYNYQQANEPRGIEKPLRLAQSIVSNPTDWITWNIPSIATLNKAVTAPKTERWLKYLPGFMNHWLDAFSTGPIARLCQWLTRIPHYNFVSNLFFHLTCVAGLVLAPFDIKNCINLWKDKKAFIGHKLCFSLETVTNIGMSALAIASLLVGRFGMGTLAARLFAWSMTMGGINMIASIPEMAVGAVEGAKSIGQKVWGWLTGRHKAKPQPAQQPARQTAAKPA